MAGITVGLVTPSTRDTLEEAIALAEATSVQLQNLSYQQPLDEFPAVLTSYNAVTGRYSWTEQTYDPATGGRITLVGGRTGTSTSSPAYPAGNGVSPPAFPVQVWLRFRVINQTLGPVYEFDWNCTCSVYGSGSGF